MLFLCTLCGCLSTSHEVKCPPLTWQGNGVFGCRTFLPSGYNYWSVGIRKDASTSVNFTEINELQAQFIVKNKGQAPLKISWLAKHEDEKQKGKVVVVLNQSEKRQVVLKKDEELVWFVGKMVDLINTKFLTIQGYGERSSGWDLDFKLQFKDTKQLESAITFSVGDLRIPLSAYTADSI